MPSKVLIHTEMLLIPSVEWVGTAFFLNPLKSDNIDIKTMSNQHLTACRLSEKHLNTLRIRHSFDIGNIHIPLYSIF